VAAGRRQHAQRCHQDALGLLVAHWPAAQPCRIANSAAQKGPGTVVACTQQQGWAMSSRGRCFWSAYSAPKKVSPALQVTQRLAAPPVAPLLVGEQLLDPDASV
jgi:hypothetical protein